MRINPVLQKELKVKMRKFRIVLMVMVYLFFLGIMSAFVVYQLSKGDFGDKTSTIEMYSSLMALQFVLIMFIAPALTAGAISGERERQTLDILLSSKMSTYSIIIGKLFASLSQIIILLVVSMPMFTIGFMFGGIGIGDMAEMFLFYLVTAFTVGCIGIFFSTFLKKTTAATVVTYGTVGVLTLGIIFLVYILLAINSFGPSSNNVSDTTYWFTYINPLSAFGSLIFSQIGTNNMPKILVGTINGSELEVWKGNLIFDVFLSITLISISARKLNPIKKIRRMKK